MGIEIEWEIDDVKAPIDLPEDDPEDGGRSTNRLVIAIGILLALIAIAVILSLREARRAQQVLTADLENAIDNELLALRIGDRDGFLQMQSTDPGWRLSQEAAFDAYQQRQGSYPYLTGDVHSIEVDGAQAEVMLDGDVNGAAFCLHWTYRYGEDGWRHAGATSNMCDLAYQVRGQHYELTFYEPDNQAAGELATSLEGWGALLYTTMGGSGEPPFVSVRLVPGSWQTPLWTDEGVLVVPSPSLGANVDYVVLDALVGSALADHWRNGVLSDYGLENAASDWMADELRSLALDAWEGGPSRTFLGSLAAQNGTAVLPTLLDGMADGQTPPEVLLGLIDTTVEDSDPITRSLTVLLQSEAVVTQAGGSEIETLPYRDSTRIDEMAAVGPPSVLFSVPPLIRVEEVIPVGEITWADVSWQTVIGEDLHRSYVPFRLVGDRWARTVVRPEDYGEQRQLSNAGVTITYRAADEPYAQPLLTYLVLTYPAIATDLGIGDPPSLDVTLTPSINLYWAFANNPPPPIDEGVSLVVSSSYETCCQPQAESNLEHLVVATVRTTVDRLMVYRVGREPRSTNIFRLSISRWLLDQRGLEGTETIRAGAAGFLANYADTRLPTTLADMWNGQQNTTVLHHLGADVLIEVLVEQAGAEVIPDLVDSVDDVSSIYAWVALTGLDVEAVEEAWQVRYAAALDKIRETPK